jgi:hypothetical protein
MRLHYIYIYMYVYIYIYKMCSLRSVRIFASTNVMEHGCYCSQTNSVHYETIPGKTSGLE